MSHGGSRHIPVVITPELGNRTHLARLLDMTPTRVSQLVRDNVVKQTSKGKYELTTCIIDYIRHLRKAVQGGGGGALTDEKARLAKANADRAELELEQTKRAHGGYAFSVAELASIFDITRKTVQGRLSGVTPYSGEVSRSPKYLLREVAGHLIDVEIGGEITIDPERMSPKNKLDYYRAAREKAKFDVECRQLVPAGEVETELSRLTKTVVAVLDTLPDILERDCSLPSDSMITLIEVLDELREQMYEIVIDAANAGPVDVSDEDGEGD